MVGTVGTFNILGVPIAQVHFGTVGTLGCEMARICCAHAPKNILNLRDNPPKYFQFLLAKIILKVAGPSQPQNQ